MAQYNNILLAIGSLLGFVLGLLLIIWIWNLISENRNHLDFTEFSPRALDEAEASKIKRIRHQLLFFSVSLFVAGLELRSYCSGNESQIVQTFGWLGLILFGISPILIMMSLDEKFASILYKKPSLYVELLLLLLLGIVEILFFVEKNMGENIPLRSIEGATKFLIGVGLWTFMLLRIVRKVETHN